MVKKIFQPIIFDIFSKKEQIATARTNSHGQAQIATACGGPLSALAFQFGFSVRRLATTAPADPAPARNTVTVIAGQHWDVMYYFVRYMFFWSEFGT
jgi:hypothetical protein